MSLFRHKRHENMCFHASLQLAYSIIKRKPVHILFGFLWTNLHLKITSDD